MRIGSYGQLEKGREGMGGAATHSVVVYSNGEMNK